MSMYNELSINYRLEIVYIEIFSQEFNTERKYELYQMTKIEGKKQRMNSVLPSLTIHLHQKVYANIGLTGCLFVHSRKTAIFQ